MVRAPIFNGGPDSRNAGATRWAELLREVRNVSGRRLLEPRRFGERYQIDFPRVRRPERGDRHGAVRSTGARTASSTRSRQHECHRAFNRQQKRFTRDRGHSHWPSPHAASVAPSTCDSFRRRLRFEPPTRSRECASASVQGVRSATVVEAALVDERERFGLRLQLDGRVVRAPVTRRQVRVRMRRRPALAEGTTSCAPSTSNGDPTERVFCRAWAQRAQYLGAAPDAAPGRTQQASFRRAYASSARRTAASITTNDGSTSGALEDDEP